MGANHILEMACQPGRVHISEEGRKEIFILLQVGRHESVSRVPVKLVNIVEKNPFYIFAPLNLFD